MEPDVLSATTPAARLLRLLDWPPALIHLLTLPLLLAALASGMALAAAQGLPALPSAWGLPADWHLALTAPWLLLLPVLWRRAARRERRSNRLLRLGLLALALSGLAQLAAPGAGARALHAALAWLLPLLVLVHGLERWRALAARKTLARLFHPVPLWRRRRLCAGALLTAALLVAGRLLEPAHFAVALRLAPIPAQAAPILDGRGADPLWQRAETVTLTTLDGLKAVPVEVGALSNGLTAFFRFRWPDPTPSLQHLPLEKRADGWHVLHEGFERDDERRYYEDKFAVMLARDGSLGGLASLVPGALPGLPASHHGRGLHRARGGVLLDLWHWKAVRNHGTGRLDDSHIGTPAAPQLGERRYAAGYRADPREAGGHADNWAWFGEGPVTPLRLPRDPARLQAFQAEDGARPWGLHWTETRPYEPALDDYPIGTRLPSVLWRGHSEGDRGDVRAAAHWADGVWTLEIARGLASRSAFDLPIEDGLWLWVAVFDHAQTRHSYPLRPLRLVFGEAGR